MDKHFEYDNVNLISIISKYRASVMGFAALLIYYFHIGKTDMLPGVLSEFEWFIHRISFCGVDIFIFFLLLVYLFLSRSVRLNLPLTI